MMTNEISELMDLYGRRKEQKLQQHSCYFDTSSTTMKEPFAAKEHTDNECVSLTDW